MLSILRKSAALGSPDELGLKPAGVQKEFVHVRVNTSGSPLEFPGALTHATLLFVEMLERWRGFLVVCGLPDLIWQCWCYFRRIVPEHWEGKGEA